jgi:large subunit ribosomal protein L18
MRLEKRVKRQRQNRDWRVGNRVRGNKDRPRLSVFRSNKYIYAQIVDDDSGRTLCSASSQQAAVCPKGTNGGNVKAAALVGKALATKALECGIKRVAFDRGGYRYHGRVAALANAARESGLDF